MKKFRVTSLLWVLSIFATALSAYTPVIGVIAACVMIAYWWAIIRWHEHEHESLKAAVALAITVRIFEPIDSQDFEGFRLIPLALFALFCIVPAWRKQEPWYDKMQ